jgi:hypothetical protein
MAWLVLRRGSRAGRVTPGLARAKAAASASCFCCSSSMAAVSGYFFSDYEGLKRIDVLLQPLGRAHGGD